MITNKIITNEMNNNYPLTQVCLDAVFGPVPSGKPFVEKLPDKSPENSVAPTQSTVRFLRIRPLRPRRVLHVGLVQHCIFRKQPNIGYKMLFEFEGFGFVDGFD